MEAVRLPYVCCAVAGADLDPDRAVASCQNTAQASTLLTWSGFLREAAGTQLSQAVCVFKSCAAACSDADARQCSAAVGHQESKAAQNIQRSAWQISTHCRS